MGFWHRLLDAWACVDVVGSLSFLMFGYVVGQCTVFLVLCCRLCLVGVSGSFLCPCFVLFFFFVDVPSGCPFVFHITLLFQFGAKPKRGPK